MIVINEDTFEATEDGIHHLLISLADILEAKGIM